MFGGTATRYSHVYACTCRNDAAWGVVTWGFGLWPAPILRERESYTPAVRGSNPFARTGQLGFRGSGTASDTAKDQRAGVPDPSGPETPKAAPLGVSGAAGCWVGVRGQAGTSSIHVLAAWTATFDVVTRMDMRSPSTTEMPENVDCHRFVPDDDRVPSETPFL